jgi:hypothetical protein
LRQCLGGSTGNGKVKEMKERVNKGIETTFQMLSNGLIVMGR